MAEKEEVIEDTTAETTEAEASVSVKEVHPLRVNGGLINTILESANAERIWPEFKVGDTLNVHYKIREGDKQRIQVYTGNVISIRGAGMGKSFIVRRVSHEIGVERIFPFHSPSIEKIEVIRKGKVRRARLFYLRDKSGKAGRIKESFDFTRTEKTEKKDRKTRRKKKASTTKKTAASTVRTETETETETKAESSES